MTYPRRMITKTAFTPTGPSTYGSAPGIWRMDEVAYWQKQGLWPNPSIIPDTYFPYVSLLLSSTSLSNANNNLFVDSSGAFNPVSRNGNTTQGSFTPYGSNWSNYFDGSGDYERIASAQTALQFGTGDFTIEGWVYSTGGTGTYQHILTGGSSWTSGSGGVYWYYNGGSPYIGAAWNQIATNPAVNSSTLAINTWHHFAVVRSGNTLYLYVNGTSVDTLDVTGVSIAVNNQSQTNIGGGGWDQDYTGYLSNLRVVKGTAVYTANFTPPTAPLTAISGTSLLTCQSNRFRDNSSNAFTITVNGDTKVQKFSPFSSSTYTGISYNQSDITNWSGYFDGSTGYLTVSQQTPLSFGTGDFCVEAWVYPTSLIAFYGVIDARGPFGASGSLPWVFGLRNTSGAYYVELFLSDPQRYAGSIQVPLNTWTHIAVSRSSGTLRTFVNGVVDYNASMTNAVNANGTTQAIGLVYNSLYDQGYISNVRAVKGAAVYTSNFTPPTSPLTAISGTSLLTCQNAAFTDNSTNNFVVTPNGNVTVTGNSPFNTTGYWSNYFDGSGDYIQTPSNAAFALPGDFTIEMWIYFTGTPQGAGPSKEYFYSTTNNGGIAFLITGTQLKVSQTGVGDDLTVNYTTASGQWYHFAITRSSGTMAVFANGTRLGTASVATSYPTSALQTATNNNGYLSNWRIVKGTAVYNPSSSTITVPTAPLTAISGTSLLTCQNGRFIDNSTNAFTITVNGNTSVQPYNPFYTATIASNGGSMYFDGSGDYLTSSSPNFAFGTGAWTIEFWIYPLAYGGSVCGGQIFGTTNGAQSGYSINLGQDINNFRIISNASGSWADNLSAGAGNGPPLNAWSHMVVVRSGANISIYRNGTRVATTGSATSWNFSGTTAVMGRFSDGPNVRDLNGYVSNLRVTGAAVYDPTQSTISVPTAPVNPTAASVIMPNGMNAGIYDATTINDMETVGNAQVSTVQSKFGGSSMYFDGSGDYLSIPASPNLTFGTGDFTMELWVYSGANGTSTRTMGNGAGASWSANKWVFATGDATYVNKFIFGCNNATSTAALLYSTTTFNDSTWKYVAITRSGNTWRLFVNGVLESTATSSASLDGGIPATITVGRSGISSDADWAGYIDDLRLTKGVARYTANFTPPTQAFPVY